MTDKYTDNDSNMKINLESLSELAELLNTADLSEVSLEFDGENISRVRLRRRTETAPTTYVAAPVPGGIQPASAVAPAEAATPAETIEEESGTVISSPLVGTFYISPGPDAPPFVKEGERVASGDTLCIIESMKTMNEIKAESSGVIKKIYIENGQPVEFQSALILIG